METMYKNFEGCDRFDLPEGIYRVTAGNGGESFLIDGGEKVALYDCGMAFCAKGLIENIERRIEKLGKTTVDYVFISHTHYDHIGALPYVIERFKDVKIVGAKKAARVFKSEGARATMVRLGEAARRDFGNRDEADFKIKADGLRVDLEVSDGDEVSLGEKKVRVYETKGHTDCSVSYMLEPDRVLFASESTGVLRAPELMHTAILKSFDECIESSRKCEALNPKRIVGNHYGAVPSFYNDRYFKLFREEAFAERDLILKAKHEGKTLDETIAIHKKKYWSVARGRVQPEAAFDENAKYIVQHIFKNFD